MFLIEEFVTGVAKGVLHVPGLQENITVILGTLCPPTLLKHDEETLLYEIRVLTGLLVERRGISGAAFWISSVDTVVQWHRLLFWIESLLRTC